jgi:hypothetical protein
MADVLGNRRVDEDLDSLTAGSPSRFQIKLYFNVVRDTDEMLRQKCDKALNAGKYLIGQIDAVKKEGK